jgi:hypothetical protein
MTVTLAGTGPPVWRRVVVSAAATLAQLHDVLQMTMGWENAHSHAFAIGGVSYGPADDEELDVDDGDESTLTLAGAFEHTSHGIYE